MPAPLTTSPACPACGRYTGPALDCPYCEVALPGRTIPRIVRWSAPSVALLGLALLWLQAQRLPLPVTPMREITPDHIGRTRVTGTLVAKPRVYFRRGAADQVRFEMADDSGHMTVRATRQVARDLVEQGRVPVKGAVLQATGNVTPGRHGKPCLYLESVNAITPRHTPAPPDQEATP